VLGKSDKFEPGCTISEDLMHLGTKEVIKEKLEGAPSERSSKGGGSAGPCKKTMKKTTPGRLLDKSGSRRKRDE